VEHPDLEEYARAIRGAELVFELGEQSAKKESVDEELGLSHQGAVGSEAEGREQFELGAGFGAESLCFVTHR
jgi:hypothetical protein